MERKEKESNYLPAGWGCAWIQTAAFTIHYTAALLGEGEFRRALTPESSQYFSLIIRKGEEGKFFLWVFFCLFVFVFLAPEKAGKEQ